MRKPVKDRPTIVTPGHGIVVDTLILHGIVGYLERHGLCPDVTIWREGWDRYKIEVNAMPPPKRVEDALAPFRYELGRNFEVVDVNIDLTRYLGSHMCEPKHELPVEIALRRGHKVCDMCAALAAEGFRSSAIIKTSNDTVFVIIAPIRTAWCYSLVDFGRLSYDDMPQVPTMAVPLYVLTENGFHETGPPEGEHNLIVWRHDGQRLTDWRVLPLNTLADFISKHVREVLRPIAHVIKEEYPDPEDSYLLESDLTKLSYIGRELVRWNFQPPPIWL
ncbi:MAG: hypothetical protein ACK4SY_09640 [Pyrobaculum sp.]